MTLDKFGSGCRCLLRARENSGKPYVGEDAFLARHRASYPDWETQPGAASAARLIELSKLMGVAQSGEVVCDYEKLIASHKRGDIVLILSRHEQEPHASGAWALVLDIDRNRAEVWAPTPDGSADVVQFSREAFQEPDGLSAIVFQPQP